MNPKVDFFFADKDKWHDAYVQLRRIILDCGLSEELKWGVPCYTHNKKNVVLIYGFKEYCAVLFMKGALLANKEGMLIQQTKNVQSARQMRFTGAAEVKQQESAIKSYVKEAIALEKSGRKVALKTTSDFEVPDELREKLDKNSKLKKAFQALTPGRQRAYLFHFSSAKQVKTRVARIEKYIPRILEGKGLDD